MASHHGIAAPMPSKGKMPREPYHTQSHQRQAGEDLSDPTSPVQQSFRPTLVPEHHDSTSTVNEMIEDDGQDVTAIRQWLEEAMKKCDHLLLLQQVQDMEDEVASLQAKVARGHRGSTAPPLSTQSLGNIVKEASSRFQTPESKDRSDDEVKVYHDHVRAKVAVKHKDPAMYEGKTVKEHTDWIYSCKLVSNLNLNLLHTRRTPTTSFGQ